MSRENVELAQRVYEAFARRDVEAMLPLMHPDAEFLPVTANLTTGGVPYRGYDGMRQYMEDVTGVWRSVELFPEEFRDLGDTVLVLGHVRARGGGIKIDNPTGWVWRMRSGKIESCRVYGSHEEALAAVGPSE